ncbi:PE-PGRS family protein [Variovorax sp. WDL1]|nr:PE-PGRS family protein [Variovorax sp. WDL1]
MHLHDRVYARALHAACALRSGAGLAEGQAAGVGAAARDARIAFLPRRCHCDGGVGSEVVGGELIGAPIVLDVAVDGGAGLHRGRIHHEADVGDRAAGDRQRPAGEDLAHVVGAAADVDVHRPTREDLARGGALQHRGGAGDGVVEGVVDGRQAGRLVALGSANHARDGVDEAERGHVQRLVGGSIGLPLLVLGLRDRMVEALQHDGGRARGAVDGGAQAFLAHRDVGVDASGMGGGQIGRRRCHAEGRPDRVADGVPGAGHGGGLAGVDVAGAEAAVGAVGWALQVVRPEALERVVGRRQQQPGGGVAARRERVGGVRGHPVAPARVVDRDDREVAADGKQDLRGRIVRGAARDCVLDPMFARARLQDPGDAVVGVVQDRGADAGVVRGLDRRGVVAERCGGAGGPSVGIQAAADGEVAGAEDQRSIAVADRLGADVQARSRGDGASGRDAVDRLGQVVQRGRADGDPVAVDAAGADVGECSRVDAGDHAVDDAAVGDGVAGGERGGMAPDVAGGGVIDVARREGQCIARGQRAAVGDVAAGGDAQVVAGNGPARGGGDHVLRQREAHVASGAQLAVEAERGGIDGQALVRQHGAARVGHIQGLGGRVGRVRVDDGDRVARGDQAGGVVDGAAAGEGGVHVGADGAGRVAEGNGGDGDVVTLDALVRA